MQHVQLRNVSRRRERQVTNRMGNSHYFVDKSGCSEAAESKLVKVWNNH